MPQPPHNDVQVRRLAPDAAEFLSALHLAMDLRVPPSGTNAAPEVSQLLDATRKQATPLDLVFGAFANGSLVSAAFAVGSSGDAAMVFVPSAQTRDTGGLATTATTATLEALRRAAHARGIGLLEVLIDPASSAPLQPLRTAGFQKLTTLRYLRRTRASIRPPCTPKVALDWADYDAAGPSVFEDAIERTYAQSLDCPELTGVRSMPDVLAGHRAVGEFDPAWWWVATVRGTPVGVLLLNGIAEGRAFEVVYMGVAPTVRGAGVGDALLGRAVDVASAAGVNVVALAVDQRNAPARRLYQRWGFREVGLRDAWIATHPSPERG